MTIAHILAGGMTTAHILAGGSAYSTCVRDVVHAVLAVLFSVCVFVVNV